MGNEGVPPLTRSDFAFVGWSTAADSEGEFYRAGESFDILAATTLFAQWSADVSYDGNGHTSGDAPGPSPYLAGMLVAVADQGTLAKDGYAFAGWNTQAGGGGTSYAADDMFPMDGAVTLYAMWTHGTLSVAYDGNGATGGTVPRDDTLYDPEDTVTVIGNTGSLVKDGFTFADWNTAANGSGSTFVAGATFAITADTRLYARWTASGGSGGSPESTGTGRFLLDPPVAQAPPPASPPSRTAPSHSFSNPLADLFAMLGSGALVDNGDGLPTFVTPTPLIFSFYGTLGPDPLPPLLGQTITTPLGAGMLLLGGVIQPQDPPLVTVSPSDSQSVLMSGSGIGGFSPGGVSVPGPGATAVGGSLTADSLSVGAGGSLGFLGSAALPSSLGTVTFSLPSDGPMGLVSPVQPVVVPAGEMVPSVRTLIESYLAQPGPTRTSVKDAPAQAMSPESSQAAFAVAADGTYRGAVQVPSSMVQGRMLVQFATYTPAGRVQAVVLPVTVVPAAATVRTHIVFAYQGSSLTPGAKKQLRQLASSVPLGTTMTSLAVGLRNGTRHSASGSLAMSRAKALLVRLAKKSVRTRRARRIMAPMFHSEVLTQQNRRFAAIGRLIYPDISAIGCRFVKRLDLR